MKRRSLVPAFVVLVSVAADAPIALRPLANQSRILDGSVCGCSYRLPTAPSTGQDLFQSDTDGHAAANIGGRDIDLEQRVDDTFEGDSVTVVLDTRTTKSCDDNDEQCETWEVEGTMTVTTGKQRSRIRVIGTCGC